ncbi:MAG TPA: hypothetical protein VMZ27_13910 [Candidatus Saccharimonadales bacterium]|nr:hypothetical protein [Candidatus Saccharimonadales bacterium]
MKYLSMLLALPIVAAAADPALTVYNQNFAVVRDTVKLDLKKGANHITFNDTTAHLEPDSVVLRDPTGKRALQILEQNYRADPVSQDLLMSFYEGKTIDFLVTRGVEGKQEVVKGKIIRSGYVPHQNALSRYGQRYAASQMAYGYAQGGPAGQTIIEIEGKLRFGLPGQPIFPALADESILKPTLDWTIQSEQAGALDAELAYITGGMSWNADYNVVAPEKGEVVDLLGWVTIDNQSGKTFRQAKIKLMAGDVSKIQPNEQMGYARGGYAMSDSGMPAPVSEKAFDEYHLYSLARKSTLLDRETKQVEFVRANNITSQRVYVYDGAKIDSTRYRGYSPDNLRTERDYGTKSNPKVWVMREFANTEKNKLGVPLPKGRVRFYRRNDDGQLEFTGENTIDHTPAGENLRIYTGDAFDLVGERKRTNFKMDNNRENVDETFEIKLRNRKKEDVEIRVVEHLYRWSNWEVTEKSNAFLKTDAQTIEFRIAVKPDEEKVLSYSVHYSW